MAKRYTILDHPSELRLRIFGCHKAELFKNACLAMAETLSPKQPAHAQALAGRPNTEIIQISSADVNTLLIDFLNEILARSQINKQIYQVEKIDIQDNHHRPGLLPKRPGRWWFKAQLIAYPVHYFAEDIKAVTYQDVDIQFKNGHWETLLVFDI